MRPNILLITDDQHRWNWFGASGTVPGLQTPHLDALRARSTVLSNAYSNCPMCVPTRFSWYSGLYASQGRQALLHNACDWPQVPMLPQVLQQLDYHTALIGKLHHQGSRRDLTAPAAVAATEALGFDHAWEVCGRSMAFRTDCHWTQALADADLLTAYREDLKRSGAAFCWNEAYRVGVVPTELQVDHMIAERCVDWLQRYRDERPFFLHASLCAPHFPLDPPREYFDRYDPDAMPDPVGVDDPDERAYWRQQRASYCALITLIDDQVGRILAALEASGRAEETVVFFLSDHGDRIGDNRLWHKSQPEDGSCRIPFSVAGPGIRAGVTEAAMAGCIDLAPTILDLVGDTEDLQARLPSTAGLSLLPVLAGTGPAPRERVYAEAGRFRMVVDQEWKYWRNADGSEALHHRPSDPDDQRNLVADPDRAAVLSAQRQALIAELTTCVAPNEAAWVRGRAAGQAARRQDRDGVDKIPFRPTDPLRA